MAAAVVGLGVLCDFITSDESERERRLARRQRDRQRHRHSEYLLTQLDETGPVSRLSDMPLDVGDPDHQNKILLRYVEFAVLADGNRVLLADDREKTISGPDGLWAGTTAADIDTYARMELFPGDLDFADNDSQWSMIVERLGALGVRTSREYLESLPYEVELSPRLRARIEPDM